ncbi:energy transducer TonB [Litorimonas sp. WD9-15]|uniref:energy transducer TonB n=1 Tax=Litorimonas sp. WD9-15 TaxID=3418716 RepID=UPI003D08736A
MSIAPREVSSFAFAGRSDGADTDRNLRASDVFNIYLIPERPVSQDYCVYPKIQEGPGFPDIKLRTPKFDTAKLDIDFRSKEAAHDYHVPRSPPTFPPRFLRGNHSGYCRLKFDISAQGKPTNVKVILCTDESLKDVSIKSLRTWRYEPVVRTAKETFIRFDLHDETGDLLPLPPGF